MKISWTKPPPPTLTTTTATASLANKKPPIDTVIAKSYCSRCGKVNAKRLCKICQVSTYCCRDCYVFDWKHGGHKDSCPTLKQEAEEVSTEPLREAIQELLDNEMDPAWWQLIKEEMPGHRKEMLFMGQIMVVLARIQPSALIVACNATEKLLKPWLKKHKQLLKSEGFKVDRFQLNSFGPLRPFVIKDRQSSLIALVDRVFNRANHDVCGSDFEECHGTWKGSVGYEDGPYLAAARYMWGEKIILDRAATPLNAEDVGCHFSKCRAAAEQLMGYDIKLKLHFYPYKQVWPIIAIVKAIVAASNNNTEMLLEWLEHDRVFDTSEFKQSQIEEITNCVRVLYAKQQQQQNNFS